MAKRSRGWLGLVSVVGLSLGVVGPVGLANAEPEDGTDPTELWLGKRWKAILDAREAKRISSNRDARSGSSGGGGGGSHQAQSDGDGGGGGGSKYDLPIYWAVSSSDAPSLSEDSRQGPVQGQVTMLYESWFGQLPHRMTDWFRPTPHDSVRDWRASFQANLDAHLEASQQDIDRMSEIDPERILILDYETIPMSWAAAEAWMPSHAHDWEETIRLINSPEIDPEFAMLAGVDVEVSSWSELERRGLADAFLRDSYNGFVRVVVGSTLGLLRSEMPDGVRLGVYGQPTGQANVAHYSSRGDSRVRQHNDELSWMFEETDVLAMSLYRMPLIDPQGQHPHGLRSHEPDAVEQWYRINMGEAQRVRDEHAPGSEILPFVWYHYHDGTPAGRLSNGRIPMLTPQNAYAQIRYIDQFEGDGVLLWGTVSQYYVRKGHASETDMIAHLKDYWLPALSDRSADEDFAAKDE